MTEKQLKEITETFTAKTIKEQKRFVDMYSQTMLYDTDCNGNNILHLAGEFSTLEIFDYILQKDEEEQLWDALNSSGLEPLGHAIAHGRDIAIVKKYISHLSEDDVLGENQYTPLHLAAGFNPDKEFTEFCLSLGYAIHHSDKNCYSPIELALEHQSNPEVIELLLEAERKNCLESVSTNTNPEVLKLLQKKGYDLNTQFSGGKSLIHLVTHKNTNHDFFITLYELGAVLEAKDNDGRTVLHYAAMNEDHRIYEFLKQQSSELLSDLNCKDSAGNFPEVYLE